MFLYHFFLAVVLQGEGRLYEQRVTGSKSTVSAQKFTHFVLQVEPKEAFNGVYSVPFGSNGDPSSNSPNTGPVIDVGSFQVLFKK